MLSSNSLWNIANFRSHIVNRLIEKGYRPLVVAPASPTELADFAIPVEVVTLSFERSGRNPWSDLALLLRYRRLIRAHRPLAYLGWTIKPNIYGAIAARLCGVPAVLNVSGLGTAFLGGGLFSSFTSALYRLAFVRAAVVFFQNADDQRLFLDRGIVRPSQARLLPGSGIDLQHFLPSDLPAGPPRFLLIARLLGDKGVREYVGAARRLRTRNPDWRFQLLGPIDEANRSAVAADELQRWVSEGVIDYAGAASDVRPFIAAATAVVLPSYREGLPRTLLEGAAMGRPLIATDVPGCRDVVQDGSNGFLCAPRDMASLSAAMERFGMLSEDDRAGMGRRSRALVDRKFSQERVSEAYLHALRELGERTR